MSFWTRFLITIGLRSQCCGAKIIRWNWKKRYCDNCGKDVGVEHPPSKWDY